MKTKAYKTREMIARYIYKRLYPYNSSVVVLFNSEERRWKLYDKEEGLTLDYIGERDEVEKVLGIDLYFTLNLTGTILWNKEKEDKFLKIRKEQILRNKKIHDFCAEIDYFSFPLELFNSVMKKTLLKDKK